MPWGRELPFQDLAAGTSATGLFAMETKRPGVGEEEQIETFGGQRFLRKMQARHPGLGRLSPGWVGWKETKPWRSPGLENKGRPGVGLSLCL